MPKRQSEDSQTGEPAGGANDSASETATVPLPSTDPATNAVITGLIVKGAGRVLLNQLEKRMVVAAYDPVKARELIDGRTMITSIALYGASKLAAKSVPGLAVVAGGMLLKTLYDRGRTLQAARRDASGNSE